MLQLFPLWPFLLLLFLPVLYALINNRLKDRRIRSLGATAPRVPSYAPWGLDVALSSMRHATAGTDLDFWAWSLSHSASPSRKTVETYLGGQRFIITADPENIKALLATQFADYGKGEPFHRDWKDFLGDSIFTTDGELWHTSRQLIRPQFVKTRVADLEIFEKHVQKLMRFIGGQGQEVDVAALFYRFTLDAATDYLFGQSVHSLDNPNTEFAAAFAKVQRIHNKILSLGPFSRFVPRGALTASLKVVEEFVQPLIDRVLRMNMEDLKEQTNQSFLHALAATGTRERQVIRDQLVAVLLAGRDTTAGALSFTFRELSRHPKIFAKLRQEIAEHVGFNRPPTYEELKNMPYLQHAMNETLRLYPSVPYNVRMSLHDTTLPTGGGSDGMQPIGVLKHTPVDYSTLFMQRRSDLYPLPSADFLPVEIYSPERWEKWQPKPWQYIPFNGGPRICIGQQFALTEMGFTIVRIVQRFERIERYWSDADAGLKSDVVLSPPHGVKVGFWEAEKS